jgi:ribosomal protein L37E
MPRRRTIACDHCGHMLLKRDEYCEACERMTRRERRLWMAKAFQLAVVLGVSAFMYFRIKELVRY